VTQRGTLTGVLTACIVAGQVVGGCAATRESPAAAQRDGGARAGNPTAAATAVIDSRGGRLALPGGASVVVPPGAFRTPTSISLREVMPPNLQLPTGSVRVGRLYTVDAAGAPDVPVEVTLPYDPTLLPPGYQEGSVSIHQLRPNGRLSMVGSETGDPDRESSGQAIDVDNNVVSVRVRILSTYTLLALRYQ
jgi:ZU5 domain-containing protein